jgi:rod shape-determining protein MreB
VLDEPTVAALDASGTITCVGLEAKRMLGRTPDHLRALRPMKDGVIADFLVAEQVIRRFLTTALSRGIFRVRPTVVIAVPSCITEVERRAVRDAAESAGVTRLLMVAEPRPAAIGAGLPVQEPTGSMIVDIGGGTTEVAVISLKGIVVARSIRVAGDEMDEDIINYARQKYNLLIGEQMAEQVKIQAGSAYPMDQEITVPLRGRNLVSGLPESIDISSVELREALRNSVGIIIDTVRHAIDETPPELISDLMEHGIALAGGGALLHGLAERLSAETRMHVYVAESPLTCVARGAEKVLENFDVLHKTLASPQRGSTLH